MTTETEFTDTTSTMSEREALGLLSSLHELREKLRRLRETEQAWTSALRCYLEENGDILRDDELGLVARLRTSTRVSYDVKSMPDGLVLQLRDLAALNTDTKVLRALEGKVIEAADVKRYAIPQDVVSVLVEKRDAP